MEFFQTITQEQLTSEFYKQIATSAGKFYNFQFFKCNKNEKYPIQSQPHYFWTTFKQDTYLKFNRKSTVSIWNDQNSLLSLRISQTLQRHTTSLHLLEKSQKICSLALWWCFVCDPMCQIRKKSSLFGTLGHILVFAMVWVKFVVVCDYLNPAKGMVLHRAPPSWSSDFWWILICTLRILSEILCMKRSIIHRVNLKSKTWRGTGQVWHHIFLFLIQKTTTKQTNDKLFSWFCQCIFILMRSFANSIIPRVSHRPLCCVLLKLTLKIQNTRNIHISSKVTHPRMQESACSHYQCQHFLNCFPQWAMLKNMAINNPAFYYGLFYNQGTFSKNT